MKIGIYDETSNSTYVGITQTMFDLGGEYDFARISPDDRLDVRKYNASLIHNYFFNHKIKLTTSAFGYTTTRNWQRQDFAYNSFDGNGILNPPPSNFSGIIWGDETIAGGAIYMRNSTGNRNRQFEVAGVESRLKVNYLLGDIKNELTAGGRSLYERAFEQRVNGSTSNSSSGNLAEDEIRTGYGKAVFAHNHMEVSARFSLRMGIRFEHFAYERDIRRGRFTINQQQVTRDTVLVAGSSLQEVIPGGRV
jgi:Fe(3+) dicitrate transport protein